MTACKNTSFDYKLKKTTPMMDCSGLDELLEENGKEYDGKEIDLKGHECRMIETGGGVLIYIPEAEPCQLI